MKRSLATAAFVVASAWACDRTPPTPSPSEVQSAFYRLQVVRADADLRGDRLHDHLSTKLREVQSIATSARATPAERVAASYLTERLERQANNEAQLRRIRSKINANAKEVPDSLFGQMFSHQVALVFTGFEDLKHGLFCGGSLIDSRWVLTAAHCFTEESKPGDMMVATGSAALSSATVIGVLDKPPGIIRHPLYNSITSENDIALVRLEAAASASPIGLPDVSTDTAVLANTSISTISGWGDLGGGATGPDRLRYAHLSTVGLDTCTISYKGLPQPRVITDAMLCGRGKSDTCQGDSGGPFAMRGKDKKLYLLGLTSFGEDCTGQSTSLPGVYTRVSRFEKWVRCSIQKGAACPVGGT